MLGPRVLGVRLDPLEGRLGPTRATSNSGTKTASSPAAFSANATGRSVARKLKLVRYGRSAGRRGRAAQPDSRACRSRR